MSTVSGALSPGRSIDYDSFADLTAVPVESVAMEGGVVVVEFADALSPEEQTAALRRITMTEAVEAAFVALEARVASLEATTEGPA